MTSYFMYDILTPSIILKIWQRGFPNYISGGASDSLDPALAPPPEPRLGSMTRKYARPYSNEHVWLKQMLGNLEAKRNCIFSAPQPLSQKRFRATDGTITTHLRQFFTFLCSSAGYPRYATAGCERKDKKIYVIKFCPPNFFDSFAPLVSTIYLPCLLQKGRLFFLYNSDVFLILRFFRFYVLF